MKNKKKATAMILDLAKGQIKSCTKIATYAIVFPKWEELGLWGKIFTMKAKTKEDPEGCDYDEKKEQIVLRILNGKLLINNFADVYTLEQDKVEVWKQDESTKIVGTNSKIAKKNLKIFLDSIKSKEEQELLEGLFRIVHADFYLIKVPAQERSCIEVTKELFDAGLTYCVNTWKKTNENGEAEEQKLTVGDFLICKPNYNGEGYHSVYRIGREEFLATHVIKN